MRISLAAALLAAAVPSAAQDLRLPNKADSLHFAIMGDTGTASRAQTQIGEQMVAYRGKFTYPLVIMVGDNMYGADTARDFVSKFESPYRKLIDAGVTFHAALGNHDNPSQRDYRYFGMEGKRYYSFQMDANGGKTKVRFWALDSTYMDKTQLDWFEKEIAAAGKDDWKIVYFHHPLYSSARRHGSTLDLRKTLEPLLVHYGVDVVFAGHDHVYERTKPQEGGIVHFVVGAGGSLRKGDLGGGKGTAITEKGFDQDYSFALAEIDGDTLHFQAISRTGQVIDSGSLKRIDDPPRPDAKDAPRPSPSPGS